MKRETAKVVTALMICVGLIMLLLVKSTQGLEGISCEAANNVTGAGGLLFILGILGNFFSSDLFWED
jgi:hypothetical protein